jgi:hypothetical protein
VVKLIRILNCLVFKVVSVFIRLALVLFSFLLAVGYGHASSSSDSDLSEDDFHAISNTNNVALSLFPSQFSPEQVLQLHDNKPVILQKQVALVGLDAQPVSLGSLSCTELYHQAVKPYWFQILSGKSSNYAGRIRFVSAEVGPDGCLYGNYRYTGAKLYQAIGTATDTVFPLKFTPTDGCKIYNLDKLKAGPCRLINLKESILGNRDFISSSENANPFNCAVPELSWYSLEYWTSEVAVRAEAATGHARLPGNLETWLLALHQLQGVDVSLQTSDIRELLAHSLLEQLLRNEECAAIADLTEKYVKANAIVRCQLLELLHVKEGDIPCIPLNENLAAYEGKIFFALPLSE